MVLVDQWGRRPLTVYGYMVTVCADFGMGATGMFDVAGRPALGSLLVFFACLATFSTTSSSAIGYAYLSEIPKQDFRAMSAGWGLAIPNLFSIMVSSRSSRLVLTGLVLIRHADHVEGRSQLGGPHWVLFRVHGVHCRRCRMVHSTRNCQSTSTIYPVCLSPANSVSEDTSRD